MQKKAAPAINVAFLTLMTLKLENNEICMKLTPNDQIDMKKLSKFESSSVWPLIWPFRPLSAFYIFLYPWHLRSLVVGKYDKSEHYDPKNNFQARFGILVHCAW